MTERDFFRKTLGLEAPWEVADVNLDLEGKRVDGTPHRGVNMESGDIQRIMRSNGLHPMGKEVMYNGKTGEPLRNLVDMGVCYYQRLKHCVSDKIHGRATGSRQILTRQPVEGRSRGGGFRVGEMERDAFISHGASSVIMDRFLNSSDKYDIPVCKTCGYMAEPQAPASQQNMTHQKPYCRRCDSNSNIVTTSVPYAWKLLTQELAAIHVGIRYTVQ